MINGGLIKAKAIHEWPLLLKNLLINNQGSELN